MIIRCKFIITDTMYYICFYARIYIFTTPMIFCICKCAILTNIIPHHSAYNRSKFCSGYGYVRSECIIFIACHNIIAYSVIYCIFLTVIKIRCIRKILCFFCRCIADKLIFTSHRNPIISVCNHS